MGKSSLLVRTLHRLQAEGFNADDRHDPHRQRKYYSFTVV